MTYSYKYIRNLTLLASFGFFMIRVDSTITATALPVMAQFFNTQSSFVAMSIAFYLLSACISIPFGSWFIKKVGYKSVFILAVSLFTLGSLGSGISHNIYEYIASQCIEGAGGSLIIPVGRLFIIDNCEDKDFINLFSLIIWPGLVAPLIAPSIGALIVYNAFWGWIYFINIPIGFALLILIIIFYPKSKKKVDNTPFDVIGFILSSLIFISAFVYLNLIESYGLSATSSIITLLISIGIIISFIKYSSKRKHPIFSLKVFKKSNTFKYSTYSSFFYRLGTEGLPFIIPLFLELNLHYSLLKAGIVLTFYFIGDLGMQIISPKVLHRFGFKIPAIFTSILSFILFYFWWFERDNLILISICICLAGVSISLNSGALQTLQLAEVSEEDVIDSNTLAYLSSQFSFALSVALVSVLIHTDKYFKSIKYISNPYFFSFIIFSLICLIGLYFSLKIHPKSGSKVQVK